MLPVLETERLRLSIIAPERAAAVCAFYQENQEYLRPWSPPAPPEFETVAYWKQRLLRSQGECLEGTAERYFLEHRSEREGPVLGAVSLTQIFRGPFQACYLGYSLAASCEGKGLMFEAVRAVLDRAFRELELHRVMANHRPENHRSARLLERLGFEREGYARAYLFIDGAWRDHVLNALTNSAQTAPPTAPK